LEFTHEGAFSSEITEPRCAAPDVIKGQASKLASPAHGYRQATKDGEQLVADVLPQVKAFESEPPVAVDGVCRVWLSDDLIKGYLDVRVEGVRIPVNHINVICHLAVVLP